jgi:hypothetical protein
MSNFRDLKTINAGILTGVFDFNLTTHCLQHFLEKEHKKMCSKMDGVSPGSIGTLLFFQVI